ncbi:hypothetical protein B0J13DRAFT_591418 [Dactylonectria estremocensis]|uniref:Zn(2)-C6 fungal-type domain-containing protein n=1 Tax=Dactylonectria estremocensis TaxID=1079267 RepID=A0A9P9JE09_9HYPO|nr:hypothetical protein B0J13DRAFT_591418 [Dactylonectria estremocensis]
MPRLGYSKSRTGCDSCKRRRVKCDENRPCKACVRHGVECSLMSSSPPDLQMSAKRPKSRITSQAVSRRRQTKAKPSLQIEPAWMAEPPVTCTTIGPQLNHNQMPTGALWTGDLKLMHHYTAITSLTLPRADEVSRIWQTTIAQLSFQHEPLLHQVLAISAYHLAYLNPADRIEYSMLASKHQNDASQALRHALQGLSDTTCHATFAAASLVLISSFASRAIHHYEGHSPTVDDMLDIFRLTRGMHTVLTTYEGAIQNGVLGDLLKLSTKPSRNFSMERLCDKISEVQEYLKQEHVEETTASIVNMEAHRLIKGIHGAVQTAQVPQLRVVMTWPFTVADEFLWLLGENSPPALALLAYYCLLVHETVPHAWYTVGWGDGVLAQIAAQLSGPWLEIIQWPLQRVAGEYT